MGSHRLWGPPPLGPIMGIRRQAPGLTGRAGSRPGCSGALQPSSEPSCGEKPCFPESTWDAPGLGEVLGWSPPGKFPACRDWVELKWRGRVRGKGLLAAQVSVGQSKLGPIPQQEPLDWVGPSRHSPPPPAVLRTKHDLGSWDEPQGSPLCPQPEGMHLPPTGPL